MLTVLPKLCLYIQFFIFLMLLPAAVDLLYAVFLAAIISSASECRLPPAMRVATIALCSMRFDGTLKSAGVGGCLI